jgi:hypothetical protein
MDLLLGAIAGAILTALLGEWRARSDDRRRRDDQAAQRMAALWRERIQQAREVLVAQLQWLQARAIGEAGDLKELERLLPPWRIGHIDLLGDADLIREYQSVLVDINPLVGTGLEPAELKRIVYLQVRVLNALNRQEERVVRGDPPLQLSDDVVAELFDPETGLASRLEPPAISPTIAGRMAAAYLNLSARLGRRKGRRA